MSALSLLKPRVSRRGFLALASGLLVPEPPRVRQYAFVEGWVPEVNPPAPKLPRDVTLWVDPSGSIPGSFRTLQEAIGRTDKMIERLSILLAPGDYSAEQQVVVAGGRHVEICQLGGGDDGGHLLEEVLPEAVRGDDDIIDGDLDDEGAARDADDTLRVVDGGSDDHAAERTT